MCTTTLRLVWSMAVCMEQREIRDTTDKIKQTKAASILTTIVYVSHVLGNFVFLQD